MPRALQRVPQLNLHGNRGLDADPDLDVWWLQRNIAGEEQLGDRDNVPGTHWPKATPEAAAYFKAS